jgi:hypothetical protein
MNNHPDPAPATAADAAAAMRARHPPIWQELVIELFFKPRRFFADQVTLWKTRYVIAVCWVTGVSGSIDRISQELLEADLKGELGSASAIEFVSPWPNYWGIVLVLGALSGFFQWWIGGWWYGVRLGWSGAKDADPRLARLVYIYASFVYAAPLVICTLAETAAFGNAIEAYQSESLWPLLTIVFLFWSLATSYSGVTTLFEVSRWKARMWFLILPAILYLLLVGAFAMLGALFMPEAPP